MEKKAEKTVVFHENGAHLFHGKFQCMYGLQDFLPVYGGLFSTEFQISQYGKIPAVTDQAAAAVCMLVNACASCERGDVNRRTYSVNAVITPKSAICPFTSRAAPTTQTAT